MILITSQTGATLEKMAYDAWDERRAVDGTNSTPDTVDGKIDNKGYTGHEMLDQLDLVHMNRRIYDPLTARLVSADVLVSDSANGQNYSRYSYVLNNPTNLIDPTGYADQPVASVEVHRGMQKLKLELQMTNTIKWSADRLERERVLFSGVTKTDGGRDVA